MSSTKFTAKKENLYPFLPSHSSRYSKRSRVEVSHTVVPPAAHLLANGPVPAYNERDWRRHNHPEGKPYYSRGTAPTLITEVDVHDERMAMRLDSWATLCTQSIREAGLVLYAGVELFLEPELEDDTCGYYFLDHETRAPFYLDANDTENLGLPPSFSEQHLKYALEQNYWQHVEMFCMHLDSLHNALEELLSIFAHGQIDHMTSGTSTFPYSKSECAEYIKALEICRTMPHNPNTFVGIARLWAHISSNRYLTHFGEEHCRLDRTTSIYEDTTPRQRSRLLDAISRLFFWMPSATEEKLNDQFVDGLVTKHAWSTFMQEQLDSWKLSIQWTFALLIGNALSTPTAYAPTLAHTSMLLCATGILVGATLCVRHQDLADADAPDAAGYLYQHQDSNGFQRMAIVYTTPAVFFTWALILFILHMAFIVLSPLPLPFGALAGVVLVGTCMAIFRVLYPSYQFSWSIFNGIRPTSLHKRKDTEAAV